MSTVGPQQKPFQTTAPIKGSFPIDHENVCKKEMLEYMICLKSNDGSSSLCRDEAKRYFECRMNKNLMDRDDWDTLGFQNNDQCKIE